MTLKNTYACNFFENVATFASVVKYLRFCCKLQLFFYCDKLIILTPTYNVIKKYFLYIILCYIIQNTYACSIFSNFFCKYKILTYD